MAVIYDTTMSPSKLELLTAWLPAQPWYLGRGREPDLTKAGGFRLDDPEGEVGVEFMLVTDRSEGRVVTYQVPLAYRGRALAGSSGGLIGTSEHGVLGPRWIYDGTRDPVLVAQLVAAIQGEAEPQAQNVSHTPDPTVTGHPVTGGPLIAVGPMVTADTPSATVIRVGTADPDGTPSGQLVVRINRILQPADDTARAGQPCLSAAWPLADGTLVRGILATAQYTHVRRPAGEGGHDD